MPIYEYECISGHRVEEFGKFQETEITCPKCGMTAKRVPSLPAPAIFRCSMPTPQKVKRDK